MNWDFLRQTGKVGLQWVGKEGMRAVVEEHYEMGVQSAPMSRCLPVFAQSISKWRYPENGKDRMSAVFNPEVGCFVLATNDH